MIRVEVKLFGAFRKFLDDGLVTLELPQPVSVGDLRARLGEKLAALGTGFDDQTLLEESAFASEEAILEDQLLLTSDTRLAILPPVCGG